LVLYDRIEEGEKELCIRAETSLSARLRKGAVWTSIIRLPPYNGFFLPEKSLSIKSLREGRYRNRCRKTLHVCGREGAMQVKQKLKINSIITAITVFIILIVLFLGLYNIKEALKESDLTDELITSLFERSASRSDYLRTGSERAKEQYLAKHEQIGRLLKSASKTFRNPQDIKNIQNLIKDHETTGRRFSDIIKGRESLNQDASPAAIEQKKEDRLAAQLEMRLYNKILLTRSLRESTDNRLSSALTLAGLAIICGLAILITAAIINSWTMGRIIMDRIQRLRKGVLVIGGGDLDYRIDVKGDDEFAALSDAFNAMSAKLRATYQDLEREIETRKRAEDALRDSKTKLEAVIQSMNDAVFISDVDGNFIEFNEAFVTYHKFRNKEECYKSLAEYPDYISMYFEDGTPAPLDMWAVPRALRGETVSNAEYMLQRKDTGETWWGSYSFAPILGKESKIVGSVVTSRDITERKRMEEALRENEEHLRNMFERHGAVMLLIDPQTGFITDANAAALEFYGYTYEKIRMLRIQDINQLPAEEVESERMKAVAGEQNYFIFPHKLSDGSIRWVEVYSSPFNVRGKPRLFSIIHDITERRRIEESNKMLAAIVESSDDAIIGKTLDGIITSWNKGAEQMYGYSKDEIIGKPVSMLAPPELKDDMRHILEKMKGGDLIEHFETVRIIKDGRPVHVSLSISPIHDAEGRVTGASTIARDITDRKKMEDEVFNLVAELERSNKDLERFAYVASHDLQEPLRMVSSFTQLLAKRYRERLDQDAKDYIEFAVNGANRMQKLINDLLLYSRVTTRGASPVPEDMNVVLGEAVANLQIAIRETGAIVTNDDLPMVMADHTQLIQVFQNLIGNAVKFHGENPSRIHISAEKTGSDWKISVKDNGIGIEQQYFERIFLIFQRLHGVEKYEGTGIGLALCKRIIQRLGGSVWVESEPGKGSTFYFTLKGVE
jgi:PAS domain S-box-containing protein